MSHKADKGKKKKKEVSPEDLSDMIHNKLAQLTKEKEVEEEAPVDTTEIVVPEGASSELREKYISEVKRSRALEREAIIQKRKYENLAKEKDGLLMEIQRSAAYKAKLEELCRELRKQNKAIVEDVRAKGEEEQQKRKELSERFNSTIGEITSKMEEQHGERLKMAQENDLLRSKIENLRESIQLHEEAYQQQVKTKELEVKMAQARQMQAEQRTAEEELKFASCQRRLEQQIAHEEELRAQLSMYSSKFETFQETLTKSNAVFHNFKTEMDKMAKKVKMLEQENTQVKKKLVKAEGQIVELTEERVSTKKRLAQMDSLQRLCKALQQERAELRASLEGRPVPPAADASEPLPEAVAEEQPRAATEKKPAEPAAEAEYSGESHRAEEQDPDDDAESLAKQRELENELEQQFAQQLEQIPQQLAQQLKYVVDPRS
eukprot:TRINITY_DN83813_c0_g1_i1.p1 TRINITY_DN83813_c0_g1~~TRINITY_DN83813_c0_g1_i1.p1  ORF type:complete len:447 (+),score=148.85 TRINITY_DN83813_c0_g1_i1:40-1341(+)